MVAEQSGRAFGITVLRRREHGPVLGRLVLPARGLQPPWVAIPPWAGARIIADRNPRFLGVTVHEQVRTIGENWRPYRTWVTLLLRTQLEYETGEITGRQGHARTG